MENIFTPCYGDLVSDSLRSFHRQSLPEQAAETLMGAISRGEIFDPLPGEMQLSGKLQISRPTLRRAIALLVKRGVIQTAKGRRTRIIQNGVSKDSRPVSVCFISSLSSWVAGSNTFVSEIQFQLTAEGVPWDTFYESQIGGAHPQSRLKEIVSNRESTCYILMSPSPIVQKWFQALGRPTIILGSCYEGIDLPSIDMDWRAVGWHAAGQFIKHGHKNVLLVEPWHRVAGVTATEQAMREYLAGSEGTKLEVLRAGPDQRQFVASLERILRGANPPTACIACLVELAISIMGLGQQFGVCIPRDLSLISRDNLPILELVAPDITRYSCDFSSMARKALRTIHELLQNTEPKNKTTLIFPEFIPGQTLRDFTR